MSTAPNVAPQFLHPDDLPDIGDRRPHDLPAWIWIGVPLAIVLLRILSPLLGYERWVTFMSGEFAVVELLTVGLLVPGVALAVVIVRQGACLPRPARVAMALGGLSVLYFLGEEISWGQHYLGYATPASVAELNYQGEFNLHNLNLKVDIFDNIPRQVMLMATIIGGVILPLVWREKLARPGAHRSIEYWLVPNYRLVPIAALAALSNVPEKLMRKNDSAPAADESYLWMVFVHDIGETKEIAFAGVMTLYLLSVFMRIKSIIAMQRG